MQVSALKQVWTHYSLISLVSMAAAILVATYFVWSSLAGYLNRCAASGRAAIATAWWHRTVLVVDRYHQLLC